MAILIVLSDDPSPAKDSAEHPTRFQVDHILDVKEDSWTPGESEKNDPWLTFVKADGPASDYAHLIEEPLKGSDGKPPARRVRSLNMTALKAGKKGVNLVDAKLGAVFEISKDEINKAVSVDVAVVAEPG